MTRTWPSTTGLGSRVASQVETPPSSSAWIRAPRARAPARVSRMTAPGALAGHEALAPGVEGPAGLGGGVGERLPHERVHQRPALQPDRIQLLRGGRDHHGVHAARAQEVDRAEERRVAARARIADHVVGALDGQQLADLAEHVGVPEDHPEARDRWSRGPGRRRGRSPRSSCCSDCCRRPRARPARDRARARAGRRRRRPAGPRRRPAGR